MAATRDLTLDQGSTYREIWIITENGSPKDLTGYEVSMMVRSNHDSTTPTLTFTTTGSPGDIEITVPATLGQVELTVSAQRTTDIVFVGDLQENVYDLEIKSVGGVVTRITEGQFNIRREVTRP